MLPTTVLVLIGLSCLAATQADTAVSVRKGFDAVHRLLVSTDSHLNTDFSPYHLFTICTVVHEHTCTDKYRQLVQGVMLAHVTAHNSDCRIHTHHIHTVVVLERSWLRRFGARRSLHF